MCHWLFTFELFRDLSNNSMNIQVYNMFGGTNTVSGFLSLSGNNISGMAADSFENADIAMIDLSNNNLDIYPTALLSLDPLTMYVNGICTYI